MVLGLQAVGSAEPSVQLLRHYERNSRIASAACGSLQQLEHVKRRCHFVIASIVIIASHGWATHGRISVGSGGIGNTKLPPPSPLVSAVVTALAAAEPLPPEAAACAVGNASGAGAAAVDAAVAASAQLLQGCIAAACAHVLVAAL